MCQFHNLSRGVGPPGFGVPRIGQGACTDLTPLSRSIKELTLPARLLPSFPSLPNPHLTHRSRRACSVLVMHRPHCLASSRPHLHLLPAHLGTAERLTDARIDTVALPRPSICAPHCVARESRRQPSSSDLRATREEVRAPRTLDVASHQRVDVI